MTPELEIILPVRNPGAEFTRTVASLVAQTEGDFGVILSDNFSDTGHDHLTDARRRLAAANIPVRNVRPPRELERIEHWNWAHAQAQSAWLKLLLPGERLMPEYVARLRQICRENPRAGLVRCDAEVATEWGPETELAPLTRASLRPVEFVEHFPGRKDWVSRSANMAYSRVAWQAAGGFAPHFPACAALHLNVILALHQGLENLPERLAVVDSTEARALNEKGGGRVNVWLEQWLIMRQARNYCLAAKLPWSKKWLLPRAIFAAGRRGG
jgi:hypothetical protein